VPAQGGQEAVRVQVAETPDAMISTEKLHGVLGFVVVGNTTEFLVASSNEPVQVDVQL
jgi:hypothetical protein